MDKQSNFLCMLLLASSLTLLATAARTTPALASPSPASPVPTNSKPSPPKTAQTQTANQANSKQPTLRLYKGYFPYHACLQVTIDEVIKKPERVLLLKATINDVYRGNYKNGSSLYFSFFDELDGPISFSNLNSLQNSRQIIAFNPWLEEINKPEPNQSVKKLRHISKNSISDLWIPYAKKGFKPCDIAQIKALIKDSPTQPDRARAAFQRLLETKWTPDRINDFCRSQNQWPAGGASEHTANYRDDWCSSPMHANKTAELCGKEVTWQASVQNNVPTYYNIFVSSKGDNSGSWNLEVASPSLEEWTDDDFLIHRVSQSIAQSAYAQFIVNAHVHKKAAIDSGLFNNRSKETVLKDKNGIATAYQCQLDNGKTMTAVLTHDTSKSIDRILINGKLDRGWTDMYKNSKANHDKCRDDVCKPTH
ncbi:MAG: hypothetical protein QG625_4624 [Cyanobacteriota bacterium erpe_2018_sw_39hr_WHONDRS-SW48-000098_B_bin.30]|nr:hypothetical protein [Cyanobacteriota bacterium erpe_2018_sw_39hr_WHONDRS-SW48-000098_B_bin.30]